jgi:hypothetical protein
VTRAGLPAAMLHALDTIHDRIESPPSKLHRAVEPWSSYVVLCASVSLCCARECQRRIVARRPSRTRATRHGHRARVVPGETVGDRHVCAVAAATDDPDLTLKSV